MKVFLISVGDFPRSTAQLHSPQSTTTSLPATTLSTTCQLFERMLLVLRLDYISLDLMQDAANMSAHSWSEPSSVATTLNSLPNCSSERVCANRKGCVPLESKYVAEDLVDQQGSQPPQTSMLDSWHFITVSRQFKENS